MKILQVINVRWFNAEAAYAYSLTRGLIEMGHEVTILGLPDSPIIQKARAERIPVFETDALNGHTPPWRVFAGLRRLVKFIDQERIEVINCHRSEGYPLVVLADRISRARPALIRTRGDARAVRRGFHNKILYTRYADGVIASGEVVRKSLAERLGLPLDDIKVIYSSVDTERFRPLDSQSDIRHGLGIPSDSPLIAILGRIDEVKGHKYFIGAAALVIKEHPSARFLIIAKEIDGAAEALKRQVRDAGLEDKVIFTGFREDLLDVMASCDIGVVSSLGSETNCRVVLEWMAMGKPVVATTVGVIPEVLRDNETGLLVAPRDPAAIAEAVGKLLTDRERLLSLGKRGRELAVTVYNEQLFVDSTLEAYNRAMRRQRMM